MNILTKRDIQLLQQARDLAKRKVKFRTIQVHEHKRKFYRLSSKHSRRLARWEEVEYALFRLSSDIERRGKIAGDREKIARVNEFLENVKDL
jgi:DNA-binding PadR family transcriptional regulator